MPKWRISELVRLYVPTLLAKLPVGVWNLLYGISFDLPIFGLCVHQA
jgi:hypothetical protein